MRTTKQKENKLTKERKEKLNLSGYTEGKKVILPKTKFWIFLKTKISPTVRQQRQNCDEVSLKEQHIGLTWWNMAVNPITPDAASEGWGKKTAWVKQWDSIKKQAWAGGRELSSEEHFLFFEWTGVLFKYPRLVAYKYLQKVEYPLQASKGSHIMWHTHSDI